LTTIIDSKNHRKNLAEKAQETPVKKKSRDIDIAFITAYKIV